MNIFKIFKMGKPEHERKVTTEFLSCLYSGNPVKYELISNKEPEPDILVKLPEKEEYYELTRILDKNWFNLRIEALMSRLKLVKVDASKFGLPERDIVVAKLEKTYNTNNKDLNLLLYYDLGILNGGYPPIDIKLLCNDIISPLLEDGSIFKKVYLFDRHTQEILWIS